MSKPKRSNHLGSIESTLDAVDARVVAVLNANARMSISDLGRAVGMSAPSVSDRVRRLEAAGVIRGFTLDVDPRALGYQIRALVQIRPFPGKLHTVERLIQDTPQFVECDKVTGDAPFLGRLVVRSIEEIDGILEAFSEYAVTSTAIIKASSVPRRLPPL